MRTRLVLVAALASLGFIALASGSAVIAPAHAACVPGTRIDKTKVEDTRDKLIKAGYKNPLHLRKGCDNAWHGTAIRDKKQINIAVTADGHIVHDGD